MTTLPSRPNTALIVIDVQVDVVSGALDRDTVVSRIAELIAAARSRGLPVIWIQHSEEGLPVGSPGWALVPGLQPRESEPVVAKHYRSAFEDTTLESVLAGLAVGEVVLCGAQTEFCVRHTLHAALERGYDVTLVGDAHTTWDVAWAGYNIPARAVIDSMNYASVGYHLPSRRCDVVSTAAWTSRTSPARHES